MTELAVYQPANAQLAVPDHRDIDSWINVVSDVIKIANVIYDTPFVPDGLRGSPPAVAAAILAGREMGLGIMTSLANIDVIKGKPSQKALLMRAMILSKGHKWQDGDVSDVRAVVRGCRKGESEWAEVTFTAAQAKTAGIDLGKYPADKLYARATSRLARRKFADVIMGMPYSAEEMEDGFDGETGEPAKTATVTGEPAESPAPRTAQRRQRAPKSEGSGPAMPDDKAPGGPVAGPDPSLPPLPGEDEPPDPTTSAESSSADDRNHPRQQTSPSSPSSPATSEPGPQPQFNRDDHGTATRGKGGQLTAVWTVLSEVFGFETADKASARKAVEHIIGRELEGETTGDLSWNEARAVLDTLANWQKIAESRGEQPMDVLIAAMAGQAGDG